MEVLIGGNLRKGRLIDRLEVWCSIINTCLSSEYIQDSLANSLGQNYPNLFHKVTNILFTISKVEKVNIVLIDISGRVVKVLVNTSKNAGSHAMTLHAGSLRKGLYYYRIQAGSFTPVKKLIIW